VNCVILNDLYVRSNGDIPCYDDAGEAIILGRVQLEKNWSISSVLSNPLYTHIRDSLQAERAPWRTICSNCALFHPHERFFDNFTNRKIRTIQIETSLACTPAHAARKASRSASALNH
jgi:hypothetical protein